MTNAQKEEEKKSESDSRVPIDDFLMEWDM
jgi:hypothetical protein